MKKNPAKDLLDALMADAIPSVVPPGFYTIRQLVEKTGMTERSVRRKLAGLRCEVTKFRVGGKPVPHYRMA